MTAIIQTERLTKSYGSHRGIVEVDLVVEQGEVFGFLGPNGAGKTTAIRVLLDLIRPTSGRAFVFGIETSVDPVAIHRRIGYLPGEFALYDRLTGGQTLTYFGNLRGGVDPAYQASLIERFDLDPSRRYREYSKGNKQKVGLVVALQHRPELLVLDEPTSALDAQAEHNLFEEYAASAKRVAQKTGAITVLVSHRFSTVRMADLILVVNDGRIQESGSHGQLMRLGGLYADLYSMQAKAYS